MYMAMDAVTGWSVVYFLLLVFMGGFFLLNLALAVITEVYDEESTDAKEQEASEEIEKRRLSRRRRSRRLDEASRSRALHRRREQRRRSRPAGHD